MLRSQSLLFRLAFVALVLCLSGYTAYAQTAPIRLDIEEDIARAGNLIPVSVYFENEGDSVSAFQFVITLNRPDLLTFDNDLSGQVPVIVAGTLTSAWEFVQAVRLSETSVRVTAVATVDFVTYPPPVIPPNSAGILIKVMAQVPCLVPDTLTDRAVTATISPAAVYFSDPAGELIEPIDLLDGGITIIYTQNGDLDGDGFHTAMDISCLIDALFAGGSLGCPPYVSDINCDGFPDPIDLAWLIDYMWAGSPAPLPCSW